MKRILAGFVSGVVLVSSVAATAKTYYTQENVTTVTQGVVLREQESYTHMGWQNIKIIEADLTAPYVYADVLTHKDGLGYAATTLDLAKQENAVAAINGDFFARNQWTKASPIGLVVQNGEPVSTQNAEINGAAVGFDENGFVFMDYIQTEAVFTAATGNSIVIKDINKYDSLKEPCVYTSAFSKVTDGSYDNILEVVVTDGIVTEMRRNQDGVEIPENGYVIRHLPEYDTFLWENVQIGDKVELSVKTSVDVKGLQSAMGGGTLLVKNGERVQFTHSITGTHPRTMAGTNQEGTKLYLITIDGRGGSAGLTMQGMQDLALELGLYTAINLDGGGSTTMVSRDNQSGTLKVNNNPSDGSLRTVPIGIGIKTDAPKGDAKYLTLTAPQPTLFKNAVYRFDFGYATDQYGNPCEMPEGNVEWASNGGTFSGNGLTATQTGKITVAATIGNAYGTAEVTVLDSPRYIYSVPKSVKAGEPYTVYGVDAFGNQARIPAENIAVREQDGGYTLSFDGVSCFLFKQSENTQDFEQAEVTSMGDAGGYTLVTDQIISGEKAAGIAFDFQKGGEPQWAGFTLNQPLQVPQNAKYMGVYVYAPYENYQWLRLQGTNQKGDTVRITLSDSMEFNGWKHLYCALPENMKSIDGFYVIQNGNLVEGKSYIALDDVAFFEQKPEITIQEQDVEQETVRRADFTVTVSGEGIERSTLYTKLYDGQLRRKIEGLEPNYNIALAHAPEREKSTQSFYAFSEGETAGLVIAANNSGISGADSSQWDKIREYAKAHKTVLLFMPCAPQDLPNRQGEVLLNILKQEGVENIYAFHPGKTNRIWQQDGINMVSVCGLRYTSGSVLLEEWEHNRFAKVSVKNGKVHVEFVKVYEND